MGGKICSKKHNSIIQAEIILKKQPQHQKEPESIRFFWRSDPNSWSSTLDATWSPYDEGDGNFLEEEYQKYQRNTQIITTLRKHKIDFKNWLQININDTTKQRPIKRAFPSDVFDIIRVHRFEQDFLSTAMQPKIEKMEKVKVLFKSGIDKIDFAILKDKKVQIEIPQNFFIFKTPSIENYQNWLASLRNEVENLAKISIFQSTEHPLTYEEEFMNISPENFYYRMIKMYTREGFLYNEINDVLRKGHKNQLQNIQFYYLSLMASLRYYSEHSIKALTRDNYLKKGQYRIMLYRGGGISENEIKEYENGMTKLMIRQMTEFVSTSLNQKISEGFLSRSTAKIKALHFIDVPVTGRKAEESPVIYIKDYSAYESEDECLILSGALLKIERIQKISQDRHHVFLRAINWGWINFEIWGYKTFEDPILRHKNNGELDLSKNRLGNIDEYEFKEFSAFLWKTKEITELLLAKNDFGSGNVENMKYFIEGLAKNQSIKTLNLSKNDFGFGNVENIKLFSERIIQKSEFIDNGFIKK